MLNKYYSISASCPRGRCRTTDGAHPPLYGRRQQQDDRQGKQGRCQGLGVKWPQPPDFPPSLRSALSLPPSVKRAGVRVLDAASSTRLTIHLGQLEGGDGRCDAAYRSQHRRAHIIQNWLATADPTGCCEMPGCCTSVDRWHAGTRPTRSNRSRASSTLPVRGADGRRRADHARRPPP